MSKPLNLTGSYIANIDEEGKDQGNLHFQTNGLTMHDIQDTDTFKNTNIGVGVELSDNTPSSGSIDYSQQTHDKAQTTKATIGQGSITTGTTTGVLHRDVATMQEITKDEHDETAFYVSDKSVALATNPTGEIAQLNQNFKDVGLSAHVEILNNLPSASKGKDGEGDFIDNTIGVALDTLGDYTMGLIPNATNDGGYVSQIATQLFGDNRTGIVVEDGSKLKNMTKTDGTKLKERKPGDSSTEWDYEKITLVKTKDGIKPLSEVENPEGLEQVTKYRTNPDKQIVIEDGKNRTGNPALEAYKIRVSEEEIQNTGINHLFTNGMFNSHDTALFNQQTQQEADGILNYNQQHGVVGDLMESLQDHLSVNGLDILTETLTGGKAEGSVDGIGNLGTGGSRQTGDLIDQMTTITNGDLTIGAHSQGTLMTQNGLDQYQNSISTTLQRNPESHFIVQYSGAPVNHVIAEDKVTDIYGGEDAIKQHIKDAKISDIFRSNVTPGDFVGSFLGYQGSGINSSENVGANMWAGILAVPRLFGIGDASPHSYYPCVIGCGEDNYTPGKGNYYTPNKLDDKGRPQSPMINYYQENFYKKDENNKIIIDKVTHKPIMTIDLDLLPSANTNANHKTPSVDMNTLQGGK